MPLFLKSAAVVFTLLATATAGVAQAETFVLDNSHTSVIFGVKHLEYSYTYGRFNKVSGGFNLDRSNPAASSFRIGIDASSIDTNDVKRDEHLRGPDFFNVKQFQTISFVTKSIKVEKTKEGEMYNMTGTLTIHGVPREVTLPVKKLGEGKGPYGKYRCGFFCQTKLKRSEFGMTNMIPNIGDEIAITVSFEGIRQEAAPAAQ